MESKGSASTQKQREAVKLQGAALLFAPFFLNDLSSIFVTDWRWWLAIDYIIVKLVPIAGAVWLVRSGRLSALELGFKGQKIWAFTGWATGLTLVCTLMDQNLYTLAAGLPGYSPLGGMPAITSPVWDWMDLTMGLTLVALCEEMVFRGFLYTVLGRMGLGPLGIIAISSMAFGLAHWCLGLHAVLITGLIGAMLMGGYVRTRSIYPLVLAHFLVNFIDFSGVIPKGIFRFF